MLRYIFRRLLFAVPTLLIISVAVFSMGKCAPGDPVTDISNSDLKVSADPEQNAVSYRRDAARFGLDKPVFYFSITPASFPDTLWKIYPRDRRERLEHFLEQNGNWQTTRDYDRALNHALRTMESLPESLPAKGDLTRELLSRLSTTYRFDQIEEPLRLADSIAHSITDFPAIGVAMDSLRLKADALRSVILQGKRYTPAFHWYGFNNQFHHWLWGFITFDWGITKKQDPVWPEIRPALMATVCINLLALLFAYLMAIPIGVEMARHKNLIFDRWAKRTMFFLNAMPIFWMGALLALLLTGHFWGKPLIPNPYLTVKDYWQPSESSFIVWFFKKLPKFTMPILVLTLHSITLIALQMRGGMLESLKQDYVRTARAKGLDEEKVHWLHAFRNALFPIITMFASIFPAMFTGSLVIETMFGFPGLGVKTQTAFAGHEPNILSSILMAAAFMTVLGNLIADLLYAWADPRVRFVQQN